MDLSEFVKLTLCQIVDGVQAAQEATKSKGANINPKNLVYQRDGQWNRDQGGAVTQVQFDVGLTASEGTGTAGGIGVFLGAVSLGSTGRSDRNSVAQTSVQFSVPIQLPPGDDASQ